MIFTVVTGHPWSLVVGWGKYCTTSTSATIGAGVKYVFVFANTNTNTAYLYLYLIKFQTMYLYLYLIYGIWCIWHIRLQIHFFPGPFFKPKFMEHKLTWIFLINKLKSVILFQNKCRDLTFLIPIGDCACALDLAGQWVCDKPLAWLYWHFAMLLEQLNVDYLQNLIITYFIKCHDVSKHWIYLCQYDWYFYIYNFWYDILCRHEFDRHPCSCCNANIHVTPLCAHSMGSLDSLQSILWSPGVKIPWIHVPQVCLLQDISKNHQYHMALFKNKKELKPVG